MNRSFNAPLLGAQLVLTVLGAVALGWLWLRGGRPEPLGLAALTVLGAPRLSLTPPSAAARRVLGLSIHGDQVALGQSQGEVAARPQQLAHLLAELVTESGWTWQGVFFNGQKSCR